MEFWKLGKNHKNQVTEENNACELTHFKWEKDMIIFFPKVIPIGRYSAGWPKFRWPNYQNPQIKNPKITQNRFFLRFDLEVVAHSESVQNTSKTPKLSIPNHISSLKSELPLKNSSRKIANFRFLRILHGPKSSSGRSS